VCVCVCACACVLVCIHPGLAPTHTPYPTPNPQSTKRLILEFHNDPAASPRRSDRPSASSKHTMQYAGAAAAANPWALLDPHDASSANPRPFRRGKTTRRPKTGQKTDVGCALPRLVPQACQTKSLKMPYFPGAFLSSCLCAYVRANACDHQWPLAQTCILTSMPRCVQTSRRRSSQSATNCLRRSSQGHALAANPLLTLSWNSLL
jgi:hypothetical protein